MGSCVLKQVFGARLNHGYCSFLAMLHPQSSKTGTPDHFQGLKSWNSQSEGAFPSFRPGHLGTNTVGSWHCGYFKISAASRRQKVSLLQNAEVTI